MSLTLEQRQHVRLWVLNNQQHLLERAVNDVDKTAEFYNAVKLDERERDGDVSRTQLSALLNMARSQELKDIYSFIKLRGERRRKAGKPREADFWDQLHRTLKALKNEVARGVEECSLQGGDKDIAYEVETYIISAYLEHFVAHCRYRTHFIIEEVE